MKTKLVSILAVSVAPLLGLAQTPATPPAPPIPPVSANPNLHPERDRLPKVPMTFLGVETSDVPSVVAEQLGLAKGFGLVVDYVVPDGPAAAAGVQTNDILRMFNDQILMEPDQLSKLVRSNAEGASVTLTVLRKGAETKLTVKLGKREVPQRRFERHGRHGDDFGALGKEMEGLGDRLRDQLGDMQFGLFGDAVGNARGEIERVKAEAQRMRDEGRRVAEEQRRMADEERRVAAENRRAAQQMRVVSRDNGMVKTTRIDLGKAQIVYNDAQGEMKIETVDNKKVLTAKDPQGRLLFSGPISTKEELDKIPAEVRGRFDKLEQKDIPAVAPKMSADDQDSDDDNDNDSDDDSGDSDNSGGEVLQVKQPAPSFPARHFGLNTVMI